MTELDVRSQVGEPEWQLRVNLAACYRLVAHFGWSDLIFTHISARLPGPEHHFLINPYGMTFDEITASSLVKIDLEGNKVMDSPYVINPAGFTIHSAIHAARDDAHCIIHTHTTAGSAVASKKDGLRFDNFYSTTLYGEIAYHDFEGITTDTAEQPRLVKSLGSKSILILRNHGLLVACPSIPEAFRTYWTLQRACEIQATMDAMQGENLPIARSVLEATPARVAAFRNVPRPGGLEFDALLRRAGIRYEDLV
jgi:ribulose-5-phosphate 4-epimerase/fuculose-1-phosphate aldolase